MSWTHSYSVVLPLYLLTYSAVCFIGVADLLLVCFAPMSSNPSENQVLHPTFALSRDGRMVGGKMMRKEVLKPTHLILLQTYCPYFTLPAISFHRSEPNTV